MEEKFSVGRVVVHTALLSVLSIVAYTVISFIAHLVLSLLQTVPIISFLTGAYYLNNTAILIVSVVASIVLVCLLHEKMGVYLPKKEDKYRTVISGIILCTIYSFLKNNT